MSFYFYILYAQTPSNKMTSSQEIKGLTVSLILGVDPECLKGGGDTRFHNVVEGAWTFAKDGVHFQFLYTRSLQAHVV